MTTASGAAVSARAPLWVRGTRVLEVAVLVVVSTAVVVEAVIAVNERSVAGLLSTLVVATGVAVSYRWRPWIGLVLVAASPIVAALAGWLPIHNWSIACFVGFMLTLRGLPGLATGLVIGVANLASVGWFNGTFAPAENPEASIAAAAALALAAAGSAIHSQRQYLGELEQRSRDASATREAAVARSIAQERLRIARDLHDSVGHEIAVVSMHLGAAEVHLATDTAMASDDLQAARAGVQAVLRETQEILHVLRVGQEPGSLAPTPEHGRVSALVESYRAAGLEIDPELEGFERQLPRGTSTAVFRIIQEALTNAERHGQGSVSLRGRIDDHLAVIEIVNLSRRDGMDTSGGGNGLIGMRERAESAGGRLMINNDGRVFSVRTELPAFEGDT